MNELFNIPRGEAYAIRYALLCEACLCDIAGFLSCSRAYMRGSNSTFRAKTIENYNSMPQSIHVLQVIVVETLHRCVLLPLAAPKGCLSCAAHGWMDRHNRG